MKRALQTLLILTLVFSAACKHGKSTPTAAPTEGPTSSPEAQSTSDFQLVGTTQHAFVGVGPGIDTSGTAAEASPSPTQASQTTFANPTDRGVMRVKLDDASDA